jgi:hypothetical protein
LRCCLWDEQIRGRPPPRPRSPPLAGIVSRRKSREPRRRSRITPRLLPEPDASPPPPAPVVAADPAPAPATSPASEPGADKSVAAVVPEKDAAAAEVGRLKLHQDAAVPEAAASAPPPAPAPSAMATASGTPDDVWQARRGKACRASGQAFNQGSLEFRRQVQVFQVAAATLGSFGQPWPGSAIRRSLRPERSAAQHKIRRRNRAVALGRRRLWKGRRRRRMTPASGMKIVRIGCAKTPREKMPRTLLKS